MLKLWFPPNVWLHGSQSTTTGGRVANRGQSWRMACWFEQSIRWVLTTPFGLPVDPDVKRIFAIVSGPTATLARSSEAPGAVLRRSLTVVAFGALFFVTSGTPGQRGRDGAAAKRAGSSTYATPGPTTSTIARSFAKSRDASEYAGDTGAAGTPACIAASCTSAWSMPLSERRRTGRSGAAPRSRSPCAIARTEAIASP